MLVSAFLNGGEILVGPATPGTAGDLLSSNGDGTTDWTAVLPVAKGGTGANTASSARSNLGLGSAALQNVGTDAGNVVQLENLAGIPSLPAVDGSQLINLPPGTGAVDSVDGRTGAVTLSDLYQPLDAELTALAGLVSAADRLPYFTGSGTAALATLTSFIRTLLDDADAPTARATLGLIIGTDVQAFDAATAKLNLQQEWSRQQNFNATTLTDAANISWDLDQNQVTRVELGGNRTLDNPTNMRDGGTYILIVKQDPTGSRTLTFGTAYKFPGGTAPTLTTTGGAEDLLSFVSDGTSMIGVAQLNLS